jgi:hypothetical protein
VKTKSYLRLCAGLALAWVVGLLTLPGFSDAVERVMLAFLAASAR